MYPYYVYRVRPPGDAYMGHDFFVNGLSLFWCQASALINVDVLPVEHRLRFCSPNKCISVWFDLNFFINQNVLSSLTDWFSIKRFTSLSTNPEHKKHWFKIGVVSEAYVVYTEWANYFNRWNIYGLPYISIYIRHIDYQTYDIGLQFVDTCYWDGCCNGMHS